MLIIYFVTTGLSIFQEHLNQQHQNPICRLCNQTFNSTMRLNEHQQNECTQIIVSCPLKDYGCLHSVSKIKGKNIFIVRSI